VTCVAARRFRVTRDNSGATFERAGTELLGFGIPIRLDTENTSELLLFEAIS
jgi:hypothetical protein